MIDWNGNGKEDWGDRFIDFQIYQDIYGEQEEEEPPQKPSGSEGGGCGCLSSIIFFLLVYTIWNCIVS